VFCSRCLHIPFIAWSLVSVVCAACIVPARITNAGGDHGIAPNKNWLRFAYDSIRICICDPLISTWPRASPVSMGPRRAMLRLCSAAGAGLCLASVPVFWLYHLGDISMATEILDWLRFTYYVFETDRLNDVTAQVHGGGRRRVLRAGHRGPGWAHGACDALEAGTLTLGVGGGGMPSRGCSASASASRGVAPDGAQKLRRTSKAQANLSPPRCDYLVWQGVYIGPLTWWMALQVRRPLRPFWRPFWLRFTYDMYATSVLAK
jgi:hypothetical protein